MTTPADKEQSGVPEFKTGDLVHAPTCLDNCEMLVLSDSLYYKGRWWTPVIRDDQDDPTFFKTDYLEMLEES